MVNAFLEPLYLISLYVGKKKGTKTSIILGIDFTMVVFSHTRSESLNAFIFIHFCVCLPTERDLVTDK